MNAKIMKLNCHVIGKTSETELDRENPDYWQKIGSICVLLATRSEEANLACATLQV